MKFILAVSVILNLMLLVDGYFRRKDEKEDMKTIQEYMDLCDRTISLNDEILENWKRDVVSLNCEILRLRPELHNEEGEEPHDA